MGTVEIRNRIHSVIDEMTPKKLNAVLSLLEDLHRSSEDETAMFIDEPGLMEDYREVKEDIRTGKTVNFHAIRRIV